MKRLTFLLAAAVAFVMSYASQLAQPKAMTFPAEVSESESVEFVVKPENASSRASQGARPLSLVSIPDGATPETYYTVSGNYLYYTENGWQYITMYMPTVEVVVDGSDIYVNGLSYWNRDKWIKGTVSGTTATFASGQQIDDTPEFPEYIIGSNTGDETTETIEFFFDQEQGILRAVTPFIYISAHPTMLMVYAYWITPEFTRTPPPAPELVQAPEGLATEEYTLVARDYTGTSDVVRSLQIGFAGNDVYLKGLSMYFPESWIKGELQGNKVTFRHNQYFGTYTGYDLFLNKLINQDVVFTYDTATSKFTLQNQFFLIDNGSYYFESFSKADITKLKDVAAMPDDPYILDIRYVDGHIAVLFSISPVDTEGDGLVTSKLSYEFYTDVDGEVTPLVFPASMFGGLDKDTSVFPYGFTDGQNFFPTMIYLDDLHSPAWDRIGVKSIYTGGGEVNATEIQWRPLKFTSAPIDIELKNYQLRGYDPYYRKYVTVQVQAGFYGDNEFYFRGFSEWFPSAWAKGTVKDNVISIEETLVATPTHILYGTMKAYLLPVDISYDPEKDSFKFLGNLYTYEYEYNTLFDELEKTVMTYLEETEGTPADPSVARLALYSEEDTAASGQLTFMNLPYVQFNIPATGTNGETLLQSRLYYVVWYVDADGSEHELTFDADRYEYLNRDFTEIPYTYADYYDFHDHGSEVYLNQDKDEIASWKKIGIQSVYYGKGIEHRSNIGWFDIEEYTARMLELASVGDIVGDATVDDVRYYNLLGQPVGESAQGIVIKRMRMSDGTVKSVKIINR